MRKVRCWLIPGAAAWLAGAAAAQTTDTLVYPPTPTEPVVDTLHGVSVPDPYRWLEDTDSPRTRAWIEAQNRLAERFLARLPLRQPLRRRLTELWNFERYGVPFEEAGALFYFYNSGLQNQSVLRRQPRGAANATTVLDPNRFSADGTVALTTLAVSPDGRYLAYGTSSGGSDWQEFRVRDLARGADLPDHLRWIKFSGASWTKDGRGFFYARYPEPRGATLREANRHQALYYHRVGTPQSADRLVYARPDQPEWSFAARVSHDGRYLVVSIGQGTDRRNRIHVLDLGDPRRPRLDERPRPLLDDFDARYEFLGNQGTVFYFRTDADAPRGRVIAVDLRRPERAAWRTVIPEGTDPHEVLQDVAMTADGFVVHVLRDAASRLRLYDRHGRRRREIPLPGLGSVTGLSARPDRSTFYFAFASFTQPPTIYRGDSRTGAIRVFRRPTFPVDPRDYVTEQVFATSKDGTRVPVFVVHRKDLTTDRPHPTILYGYGGFNIPVTPSFSVANLAWLERGGIYAVANLRGGSEYGEAWHRAGMRERKQNVFDDFLAASEHLIRLGWTEPKRLGIYGRSNGGLLVGAALTQRPERFGAAVPAVGVLDMLRFHKFTIGWAWVPEYGSADDPAMFPVLRAYSPYHNVRPGTCYPPTLILTGDHDDRVVPGHSFKFAAALQAAQGCANPVLIRIETRAGHGAGKPTWMQIEEEADRLAFFAWALGLAAGDRAPER